MKIKRIKIHNLYSYYDAEFELDDYNVIVGPNGAGKTNIVRILRMLVKQQHGYFYYTESYQKFDKDEKSSIILEVELTDKELDELLENVFPSIDRNNINNEQLRYIGLGLYFNNTLNNKYYSDFIVRFDNGFSLIIKVHNVKDNYVRFYHTYIDSLNNVNDIDEYIKDRVYPDKGTQKIKTLHTNTDVYEQDFINSIINILNNSDISDKYNDHNKTYVIDWGSMAIDGDKVTSNIKRYKLIDIFKQFLISKLIVIDNKRPIEKDLSADLFKMKNSADYSLRNRYKVIQTQFKKFFLELSFDVFLVSNGITEDSLYTFIKEQTHKHDEEHNPGFKLEDSASGYFEILYILSYIIGKKDSIIILDEPALHLHPVKIKQLANELKKLVEESGNQVMLITHSPYFVTYELLEDESTNLLYVRKDDNGSKVYHKPKDFKLKEIKPQLVPHLFKPDIFFSQCIIIVEGSSDQATLSAISHNLGMILENNNIVIIYADNKDYIDTYIKLCNIYKIPYIVMKDSDNNKNKDEKDTIFLEPKLEHELKQIYQKVDNKLRNKLVETWKNINSKEDPKIKELEAYKFMDTLMKDKEGREKIKNSKFYTVLQKAFEKIGKVEEFEKAWS